MAALSSTWATTRKDFNGGDGGLAGDIVLTFPMTAATSLNKGDLVKLTTGRLVACTATTDNCIGVMVSACDNSSGAAEDISGSVIVKGIARVNAFLGATGNSYEDALVPFSSMGLSGDAGTTLANGQGLSCGPDCTVQIGTCLSTQALTGSALNVSALCYIDTIGRIEQTV